ncbi:hypothetical protein GCM10010466_64400 [Planomonospora alba]|uniref:Uncharacterized protein n=1 Tax=Planomonospora alba TaxID=161354 RepID=A0ABP6P1G6_9ACTN
MTRDGMSRLARAWAGPAPANSADTDTIGATTATATSLRTVVTTLPFVESRARVRPAGRAHEAAWTGGKWNVT